MGISGKAAGLIVAYSLQNKNSLKWNEKTRLNLLSSHAKVFVKEGASMIIYRAFDKKGLENYCREHDSDDWGKGTKVRQDITKLLEAKIKEFKGKLPAGVKEIAKCFEKRRIKGI